MIKAQFDERSNIMRGFSDPTVYALFLESKGPELGRASHLTWA